MTIPGRVQSTAVGVPVGLASCLFRDGGRCSGRAYDCWIKPSADLKVVQEIKPIQSLPEGIRQQADQKFDVLATCLRKFMETGAIYLSMAL